LVLVAQSNARPQRSLVRPSAGVRQRRVNATGQVDGVEDLISAQEVLDCHERVAIGHSDEALNRNLRRGHEP
jgi:hypothetical protein